jgi:hypothetical protein
MSLISQSGPVDCLLTYVTNGKAVTFVRFHLIKPDTLIELIEDSRNDRNEHN